MSKINRVLLSAFIGGAFGMYLMGVIACWQLCWLGAIIGGLAGAVIYDPKKLLEMIWKPLKTIGKRFFELFDRVYNLLAADWGMSALNAGVVTALIGWVFFFHYFSGDNSNSSIAEKIVVWLCMAFFVSLCSIFYLMIMAILSEEYKKCEPLCCAGFFLWMGVGIMGFLLFNPWLAIYTAPLTIAATKAIAAFLTPIFTTIGLILMIALIAALIGLIISLSFLFCVFFLAACDWLTDLIVKIARAVFFDNRLMVFLCSTLGAVAGHLFTGNPVFCLWGGALGATFAWLMLFMRWYVFMTYPNLPYDETFKDFDS